MPSDIERRVAYLLAAGDLTPEDAWQILGLMGSTASAAAVAQTAALLRQEAAAAESAEPDTSANKSSR